MKFSLYLTLGNLSYFSEDISTKIQKFISHLYSSIKINDL